MRLRGSIPGTMLGIAALAFPCGVLASVLNNRPFLGLDYCLDTGTIPSVTALIILMPVVIKHWRTRVFFVGFVASGWLAVIAYVALCKMFPEALKIPVIYYINEIEPNFMDEDTLELYTINLFWPVSLLTRGFIMAIPQLLVALTGGILIKLLFPYSKLINNIDS